MHRGPYATSYWLAKANQVGEPPGPDSRLAMAPQNAKCFGISVPSLDLCVYCTRQRSLQPHYPLSRFRVPHPPRLVWRLGSLAAWLLRCFVAASLAAWLPTCLTRPLSYTCPEESHRLGRGSGRVGMLPKADPGREAWKARSSADESGFQCISAGTSPPGLSTPGWEGTATVSSSNVQLPRVLIRLAVSAHMVVQVYLPQFPGQSVLPFLPCPFPALSPPASARSWKPEPGRS